MRLAPRLEKLYGEQAEACLDVLMDVVARFRSLIPEPRPTPWNESDVVLITYPDQITRGEEKPLSSLGQFLVDERLHESFTVLHILPFMPASSDEGFSVIDYRRVDEHYGSWDDIHRLGEHFELMFDLVLNHVSRESRWFHAYLEGVEPYLRYFIETDPTTDLADIVRPRATPLLTPVLTRRGERHLWTTFSDDQIDLNYREPAVLVDMLEVLLDLVRRGARIVRLDAVAYLWKTPGTGSVHLPETHEIVKLMRDLIDGMAPATLLLTETNVAHEENVRYFGDGDEAHLAYQFSLPPLLLDAFLTGDAGPLMDWMGALDPSPPGTAFINFTASHDGVGLAPATGLLSPERTDRLIEAVKDRGGLVSTRNGPEGASPYELNVSYFDALGEPEGPEGTDPSLHVRRYLATQAVMLALKGIPAVYFHSLLGTPNDTEAVRRTGRARAINRRRFDWDELRGILLDRDSPQAQIFSEYRTLLSRRRGHAAFHPDAPQSVVRMDDAAFVAFYRGVPGESRILVIANASGESRGASLPEGERFARDLLHPERRFSARDTIELGPYEVAWCESDPLPA